MQLLRIPQFLYVERSFISLISIFFNGFLMKFPAHAFKTDLTPICVVSEIKSGKRSLMGTNTKNDILLFQLRFVCAIIR
jgi:hypothetical protein